MDWSILADTWPLYVRGIGLTLVLLVLSMGLGLLIAVPLGIARASPNPLLNFPVWCYTYFFRGTPQLVQLYLAYYGTGQFAAVRESFAWVLFADPMYCSLLVFGLNTGAYTTEILRGAIVNTPHGEIEAARACGMSYFMMLRRVILPSAFRRALPAYGNEVVFVLHGTSLASIVTLMELTGAARVVASRYYATVEAYLPAALCYMALTFTLVWLFRQLERHWFAHLRQRPA